MSRSRTMDGGVDFFSQDEQGRIQVMTLPPEKLGDKGQRYEIRAQDEDGQEFVVGWGETPDAWEAAIAAHPSWHSRRVIDRQPPPRKPR